jgi:galactokinase
MPAPAFKDLFGRSPAVRTEAPGRVNLIGEHTDYNGGFVLPVAIPQRTHIEAAPRPDRMVRVWSVQYPESAPVEFQVGEETRDGNWADYVKGMTRVLAGHGPIRGFDARIASDVPLGSGLSSSAALEIAIGRALREMFRLAIDDVALAVAARQAENEFVGAPVGIMDQMACSLADTTAALFLDTRSLVHARVPLPSSAALIVINSGVAHRHAGGEYALRRQECADAANLLGVDELRDISVDQLAQVAQLPAPLNRRARHVVTENQRVLETVGALQGGDLVRAGRLFLQSHASMRDDFEISIPPIDLLVGIAERVGDVYGARMTGGGFGGSVVALAAAGRERAAASRILQEYHAATGEQGSVLVPAEEPAINRLGTRG